jgi:hypothetical protein
LFYCFINFLFQALQHPWLKNNNASAASKELKVGQKMAGYVDTRKKENPTTKDTLAF